MPDHGVEFAKETKFRQLLNQWRANIPGGEDRIKGFEVYKVLPPEFEEGQSIAPEQNDLSGYQLARQMAERSSQEVLVVYGDEIYPPARHSLMQLAKDLPYLKYGLKYENEASAAGKKYIAPGKYFSVITGKTLAALQGKLERHIDEYATQDRVSGFLAQMYEAWVTLPTDREYSFSQVSERELGMHGADGRAIKEIVTRLNGAFLIESKITDHPEAIKKDNGWKRLEMKLGSTSEQHGIISQKRVLRINNNDRSAKITIDTKFFDEPANMQRLEKIAEAMITEGKGRRVRDSYGRA